MEFTTRHLVEVLRRTGHTEAADEALRILPERPEPEELFRFAARHGITKDALISEMGGSP